MSPSASVYELAAETVDSVRLDELYSDLRDQVPSIRGNVSASRALILKEAIKYIEELNKELVKQKKRLEYCKKCEAVMQ